METYYVILAHIKVWIKITMYSIFIDGFVGTTVRPTLLHELLSHACCAFVCNLFDLVFADLLRAIPKEVEKGSSLLAINLKLSSLLPIAC